MKVLSQGHYMSNAEVLHWIKQKRLQHSHDKTDDKAAGLTPSPPPSNLLNILDKTARHLESDAYPYSRNPSAYPSSNQTQSIQKFQTLHMERIQRPLMDLYKDKVRKGSMTVEQAKDALQRKQQAKELTEMELLMLHNHAPMCVEMLQPMIENVEERFTDEEQLVLLECVKEVFRVDELRGRDAVMTGADGT